MGKVDAMRAMREERLRAAESNRKTGGPTVAPAAKAARSAAPPTERRATDADAEPEPEGALCGHRNMGGKTCSRPLDHVKDGTRNHRYG